MKTLRDLIKNEEILFTQVKMDSTVTDLVSDSRMVKKGTLFVAVRGTQVDGHQFIPDVLAKGGFAVVDKEFSQNLPGIIKVSSTRRLLGDVAARFWNQPTREFQLVGITGTNGKTTTAFLLDQVWTQLGLVTGLIGTVKNKIASHVVDSNLTTPGPLELQALFHRMVQHRIQVCAMEVSSIALDQQRINGSNFSVGVFTNFTQDHLDYHQSMESYFESKLRFFRDYHLPAVVVNLDDKRSNDILRGAHSSRQLTFSLNNPDASFCVLESEFKKTGTWAKVKCPQGNFEIKTPLIGSHNLQNVLGVLSVVEAQGLDFVKAIDSLKNALGAPGRLERAIVGEYYPNVFVDYAHTDDALENVLKALRNLKGSSPGKIITVFGCGGDRDRTKRPKMAKVASLYSDITIITSDNPRTEDPESILNEIESGIDRTQTILYREVNRKAAIHLALTSAAPEDIVLVAGKGHENYQIIGTQKHDFDDKLVIQDFFNA